MIVKTGVLSIGALTPASVILITLFKFKNLNHEWVRLGSKRNGMALRFAIASHSHVKFSEWHRCGLPFLKHCSSVSLPGTYANEWYPPPPSPPSSIWNIEILYEYDDRVEQTIRFWAANQAVCEGCLLIQSAWLENNEKWVVASIMCHKLHVWSFARVSRIFEGAWYHKRANH